MSEQWQPPQYDPYAHQQRVQPGQPQQPGYHEQYPRQPYPGQPYPQQQPWAPQAAPRKKRRIFLWVFLAIQVLFLIWIIAGIASHPAGPTAAQQAAQQCANGGWHFLFKSQADCQQHYAVALNDAGNAGKGIGVALIVIFWVITDFFLGVGYGIYKLASR